MKAKDEHAYQRFVALNNIDINDWPDDLRKNYLHVEELVALAKDAHDPMIKGTIRGMASREAVDLMEALEEYYGDRLQYNCEREDAPCEPVLKPKVPKPTTKEPTKSPPQLDTDEAVLKKLHDAGAVSISTQELDVAGFKQELSERTNVIGDYVLVKVALRTGYRLHTIEELQRAA